MTTVNINGVEIDIRNHCAILDALLAARITLATGGAVVRTRFGNDEVQFAEVSDTRLDKLISTYERLCDRGKGVRRRHAMGVSWI